MRAGDAIHVVTVLLSTSTAVLFGVADFLGGFAARRHSAIAVTAVAHSVGIALFAAAAVAFPAPYSAVSVTAGVSAGVCGGIGVAALYAALARGRMSVIAPLTAALSGSLPAVYGLARGEGVSPSAAVGLALALAATIVVSATSAHGDEEVEAVPPVAIALAVVAGFGFAGSFLSFSFATDTSGFWPLLAARLTSSGMLALVVVGRRGRFRAEGGVMRTTLLAGVLDSAANVTMVSAIRVGPLAVASVLGSLYPVVTVLLARVVLGERLHGWQRAGVALALVAVLLASIPWPPTALFR